RRGQGHAAQRQAARVDGHQDRSGVVKTEGRGEAGDASPGEARQAAAQLLAARRRKLEALREAGVDPFPHAYPGVMPVADVKAPHAGLEPGEETDARVRVAGRLAARRGQGKMAFLD